MTGNANRKKKRLPAPERKKVILDAALQTFVEFGYHGALMETIAERAEVTKPILYRHFPSKLDLLLTILDQAGEELSAALLEPPSSQMNWITAIRYSIHSYFEFIMRSEMTFRIIYVTDLNVDSKAIERVAQIRNGIIDIVAERLSDYIDPGLMSTQDIKVLAVMLVGMTETAIIHWMNNKEIPIEVYERNLVRGAANILAGMPSRTN